MSTKAARVPVDDADDEYWHESRRPLAALAFLVPLFVLYEAGVACCGGAAAESVRNRADFWMRSGLEALGAVHACVLPALVVLVLIGWHVAARHAWRLRLETPLGMAAESLLFAFALILFAQLQNRFFDAGGTAALAILSRDTAARAVNFVGAGLYEETLFRLCLVPAVLGILRLVRMPRGWAAMLACVLTAVAFAAAHHIEAPQEPVSASVFAFRTAAGMFFGGLFLVRGFGITAGTHAAYDLLVGFVVG